jgi:predicted dehydrogenase
MRPIGIGIFGYGFIANAHLAGLRRIPEAHVLAVTGPNHGRAESFASTWGIDHVTTDRDELLDLPGLDAVIVDSPDGTHHDIVVAAANAGKHIFCEKPLANSLVEAQSMADAVARAGVRSCMGYSNRWNPAFVHVRDMIHAGTLGTIHHVHAQAFNHGLVAARPRFTWRTDANRAKAGIVGDLGAHMIDLIRFLAGDFTDVCASLRTFTPTVYDPASGTAHPHRLDDDSLALFHLASGAQGTLSLSKLGWVHDDYPVGHRQLLIDGAVGGIAFQNGESYLFRGGPPEKLPGDVRQDDSGDHLAFIASGTEKIMRTFLRSIDEGVDVGPTVVDGLRCQEVIDAMQRSSRESRWMAIGARAT